MNTTKTKIKLARMKVIYNDDMAILDFLCDLEDREVIKILQCFLNDAQGTSGLLLYGGVKDNLQILFLFNDPFGYNENGNKLVMYADHDIYSLCEYFKNQLDHTSRDAGSIYLALEDITAFLFLKWNEKIKYDDYVRHGKAT